MGGAGPTYLKVLNRNNQIVRASDVIFDEDKPHLDCPYDSETEKQGTIAETVKPQTSIFVAGRLCDFTSQGHYRLAILVTHEISPRARKRLV